MIVRFGNKKVIELYEQETKIGVSKYKFSKFLIEKYKQRIGHLIDAPDLKTIS